MSKVSDEDKKQFTEYLKTIIKTPYNNDQMRKISELLEYDIKKLKELPPDIFSDYVTAANNTQEQTHHQTDSTPVYSGELTEHFTKMDKEADNLVEKIEGIVAEKAAAEKAAKEAAEKEAAERAARDKLAAEKRGINLITTVGSYGGKRKTNKKHKKSKKRTLRSKKIKNKKSKRNKRRR